MSYEEILQTRGRFRVKLVNDEYPHEPYDDGQSPLLQLDYSGHGYRADHVMATGRPLDDDARIEEAAERWGSQLELLEKYLRAYYGVTRIVMDSGITRGVTYITYDPVKWREHVGAPAGSVDMSEWRAYCEGDVWGWVVEKLVSWHTDDPGYEDHDEWEHEDSCWGYYGSDGANGKYLRDSALEALADAAEPYEHLEHKHEIRPDLLARWDYDTATVEHNKMHQAVRAAEIGHVHPDPHDPFAMTAAETSGSSGR